MNNNVVNIVDLRVLIYPLPTHCSHVEAILLFLTPGHLMDDTLHQN